MHDKLNALRLLYGETATDGLPADAGASAETEAEVAVLAEVKAALDTLPARRPSPSVIDAVVAAAAAAQDATLAPIRAAYGEAVPTVDAPEAEAEVAAFVAMKTALDRLPPRGPDASTIDAVMAAAVPAAVPTATHAAIASTAATVSRAADRPARRGARRGVVVALSAVFALVVVFGSGLWLASSNPAPEQVAVSDEPVVGEEAESGVADASAVSAAPAEDLAAAEAPPAMGSTSSAAKPSTSDPVAGPSAPTSAALADAASVQPRVAGGLAAARAPAPSSSAPPASVPSESAVSVDVAQVEQATARSSFAGVPTTEDGFALAREEALPLADGDEELQTLYLRLREMQASQVGIGWGEPPVALGADARTDSTPRAPTTGWMQVRVQR